MLGVSQIVFKMEFNMWRTRNNLQRFQCPAFGLPKRYHQPVRSSEGCPQGELCRQLVLHDRLISTSTAYMHVFALGLTSIDREVYAKYSKNSKTNRKNIILHHKIRISAQGSTALMYARQQNPASWRSTRMVAWTPAGGQQVNKWRRLRGCKVSDVQIEILNYQQVHLETRFEYADVTSRDKWVYAPMRGWTTSPEMGPARKTIDIADLDNPRDMRYGVPEGIFFWSIHEDMLEVVHSP